MTEPDGTEPLPGLGEPDPSKEPPGVLESAARRSLANLKTLDVLTERHAGLMQLLIVLGRQIDRAANSTKAKDYAVANLAGQFRDTWTALQPTEGGGDSDEWDDLIAKFVHTPVRDRTEPGTPD